jgi:sulfate permease, SulP family
VIGAISMVVKVVGVETNRGTSADLDAEFRWTGIANLIAAPLGGLTSSLLITSTRLLTEAGGTTRWSGVFAALIVGAVVFFKINLPAVVPVPILAGLILVMGYSLMADSLRRILAQRDWLNLALALIVAVVSVRFGYIHGVLFGFVCACLLFAVSYSRIDLVRRQTSRAAFAGNVEHPIQVHGFLTENGHAIQIFWLSGYMFFGSIEGLFARIEAALLVAGKPPVRFAVIDLAGVSGADATAMAGFQKIKALLERNGAVLVLTGAAGDMPTRLVREGVVSLGGRHRQFPTLAEGLVFAEDGLIADLRQSDPDPEAESPFQAWLASELGSRHAADVIDRYFKPRTFVDTTILYRAGDRADTIDLVDRGRLSVVITNADGAQVPLRYMARRTVVGEMGFVRREVRAATILADAGTTVRTLTRRDFEAMQKTHPELALSLLEYMIRTLSDRLDFANKTSGALV